MHLIYMMMGLSFGRTVERRSRDTIDDSSFDFKSNLDHGRPISTYSNAYASPTNNDDSSLSREKRVVSQLYQNHKSRVHSVNQTLRLLRAIKANFYEQVPKRAHFNKKNSGQIRVRTKIFEKKFEKFSKNFQKIFKFFIIFKFDLIFIFRENYITTICDEHTDNNFDKFRPPTQIVWVVMTRFKLLNWIFHGLKGPFFLNFCISLLHFSPRNFRGHGAYCRIKKLNLMPASFTGHMVWLIPYDDIWANWIASSSMVKFKIGTARLEHLIFLRA